MAGISKNSLIEGAFPLPIRPGVLGVLRDALPVAGLALLVFQGLRTWVCERYLVPSDSMQPTLYGDPVHGDVVLVDKLSTVRGLKLHDLVVVRNPSDPDRLLVKRIAGLGDDPERCYVALQDGDLWLGPDPQHLQPDRKQPLATADMRVTWFEYPPQKDVDPIGHFLGPRDAWQPGPPTLVGSDLDDAQLLASIAPAERRRGFESLSPRLYPEGWLGTVRPVETTFLDAYGNRRRDDEVIVRDAGVELDLDGDLDSAALCIEQRPDTYCWIVRKDVRFYRNGELVGAALPRPAGALAKLQFGFLDGCFFLALGDLLIDWRPQQPEWLSPDPPVARMPPKGLLYWRGLGTGRAEVRRARVFRDLWYATIRAVNREPWPKHVPPGTLFLLGDNSFDSDDSRQHGTFPLRDFVGRPRAVLGPWPRLEWLAR